MSKEVSRRDFIKVSGGTLAAVAIGTSLVKGRPAQAETGQKVHYGTPMGIYW